MKSSEGNEAVPSSFLGLITKEMGEVTSDLLGGIKQDTGKGANVSRILAELFMWNWIRKYADGKYEKLMSTSASLCAGSIQMRLVPGRYPGTRYL
jgi:predicted NUDIX family phosphoesterase